MPCLSPRQRRPRRPLRRLPLRLPQRRLLPPLLLHLHQRQHQSQRLQALLRLLLLSRQQALQQQQPPQSLRLRLRLLQVVAPLRQAPKLQQLRLRQHRHRPRQSPWLRRCRHGALKPVLFSLAALRLPLELQRPLRRLQQVSQRLLQRPPLRPLRHQQLLRLRPLLRSQQRHHLQAAQQLRLLALRRAPLREAHLLRLGTGLAWSRAPQPRLVTQARCWPRLPLRQHLRLAALACSARGCRPLPLTTRCCQGCPLLRLTLRS